MKEKQIVGTQNKLMLICSWRSININLCLSQYVSAQTNVRNNRFIAQIAKT